MDRWIKSAVMAAVTIVWTIYMLVGVGKWIFAGEAIPDPAIWGVPGMVWLALNPPFPTKKQEPPPQ